MGFPIADQKVKIVGTVVLWRRCRRPLYRLRTGESLPDIKQFGRALMQRMFSILVLLPP